MDYCYRLYLRDGLVTVICIRSFDTDIYYEKDLFVKNSKGEPHRFEEEHEAIEKLNEWYKPEEIDPEYRNANKEFLTRD